MEKEFKFVLDEKMTIWNRKKFVIEATNLEEAKSKAIEAVKNGDDIDFYSSEFIYETEQLMQPNQNNGNSTVVLMLTDSKTNKIYENDNN